MKSMWMFRTNLRNLEYYHDFKTLEDFKNGCHDFYLMMGMWYLENDYFDEFVVWRLAPNDDTNPKSISWILENGTRFVQNFVKSFDDIFEWEICCPDISFFRGGFQEYDRLVNKWKENNMLGTTLYLGAGQRTTPKWGGKYDKILVESDKDLSIPNSNPFYKTCNPKVFYVNDREPMYDICFVANFTQNRYKGQEFFIKKISKSPYLRSLNIVHIGNKPEYGHALCKKYDVSNIKFGGYKSRTMIHVILNKSKYGIICSNERDGCPRVITEILSVGTPLIIRERTRLLSFYKELGVVVFRDENLETKIKYAMDNYSLLKEQAIENTKRLTMQNICNKNFNLWKKDNPS